MLIANALAGQIMISGTVYDSTKIYGVTGVFVKSTGGSTAFTDSVGIYHIYVAEPDSISFTYRNKPTIKFPVKTIMNYNEFNISLRVRVFEKYRPLKEVIVYSKSYKQDSAENRLTYSKIFDSKKPGLHSTFTPGSPPGLDLDQLINIFHFRRNKQNLAFQKRMIEQEQENYINYRFNGVLVKRITGLSGTLLETYLFRYRPSYGFVISSTQLEFYEYILNTSYEFKKLNGINLR